MYKNLLVFSILKYVFRGQNEAKLKNVSQIKSIRVKTLY